MTEEVTPSDGARTASRSEQIAGMTNPESVENSLGLTQARPHRT